MSSSYSALGPGYTQVEEAVLITLQRQSFEEVSTWKFPATKNLPHTVMGTTLGRILSVFGPQLLCRVEIIPAQVLHRLMLQNFENQSYSIDYHYNY